MIKLSILKNIEIKFKAINNVKNSFKLLIDTTFMLHIGFVNYVPTI